MGGQLDGNFVPGSLPHKFILIVTLIICFVVNKFLSPSFCRRRSFVHRTANVACIFCKCSQQHPPFIRPLYRSTCVSRHAPPVKNWRILLVQSFTAHMPLLTATSAFGLGRRRWSFPQQRYLHCLCTNVQICRNC